VQFSWTQASGFQANEAVWQLDNVAVLFANQINTALLDTFTRPALSSSVLFYSAGTIEVNYDSQVYILSNTFVIDTICCI